MWNLDTLNIMVYAARQRSRAAYNDRISRSPLGDPDWPQIKARAEREGKRTRLWLDRLHEAESSKR